MTKNEVIRFDPTLLLKEECNWLLENIDKPAVIALQTIKGIRLPQMGLNKNNVIYPDGVNPNAVKPLLERIAELEQLEVHEGQKWVGREALKDAIKVWLAMDAKWAQDYKRTRGRAPRYPSLYSFDSKGRAHFGGPGSDSGMVKTYFDKDGNRREFAIDLVAPENYEWSAPGFTEKPETGLTVEDNLNRIACFCGHTENYKPTSRSSYAAARARISKHLRNATEEVEKHRELYTNEFGG